jgi:hypothetical protein
MRLAMFKEVLHVQPQLDSGDLTKMESALGSRFKSIAKKFGKGLAEVLKGGGVLGAVSLIADKLLNPLKEVQEAIDKSLHAADSIKDQAERFNTTPAELVKLQAFGKAKGLDPTEVNELIGKFQAAVATAKADPSQNHSVKNFVNDKDTGQAFLTFIENLSKLSKTNPNEAIRVQQEIFGERQIGKSGNFLRADFVELNKKFSQFDTGKLDKDIEKLAGFQSIRDASEAIRDIKDIGEKSKAITGDVITSLEKQKDIAQARENEKVSKSEGLIKLQTTADGFIALLESKALPLIGEGIGKLEEIASSLSVLSRSRLIKGLLGKKE